LVSVAKVSGPEELGGLKARYTKVSTIPSCNRVIAAFQIQSLCV
jgi:hypothetical protein